jgi:SSS family solute:Na+ symporter
VAAVSWIVNFVTTIVISLLTKPKPEAELKGLVYSLTEKPKYTQNRWYQNVGLLGLVLLLITVLLNLIFF